MSKRTKRGSVGEQLDVSNSKRDNLNKALKEKKKIATQNNVLE